MTDLVANIDANAIIQAAVSSGAELWFEIGQRMGFSAVRLRSATANKGGDSSKLRALVEVKQADFAKDFGADSGTEKAMELLLSACQDVSIFQKILKELRDF